MIRGPVGHAVAPRDEQAPVEDLVVGRYSRKLVRRLAVFNLRCHPGFRDKPISGTQDTRDTASC